MRLECTNPECPVITFTEWLPAVPPRKRLTSREREEIGAGIGDDLLSVAAAARRHGVCERTAQAAFDDYADEKLADLEAQSGPVKAAGIDEFRRGGARPASGDRQARPEWFTHLVDPDTGGTLGLAQERTGAAGKSLVKDHQGTLRYLAMDLSAPYRSTVPDGVTVIADAFHVVQLANRKIDAAFRRLSYRTEHSHEDLGLPRPLHYMLRHNIENLHPDHRPSLSTPSTETATGSRSPPSGSQKSSSEGSSRSVPRRRASLPRPAPSATGSPPSTCGAPTTTTSPN
jgi:hypothetical protein